MSQRCTHLRLCSGSPDAPEGVLAAPVEPAETSMADQFAKLQRIIWEALGDLWAMDTHQREVTAETIAGHLWSHGVTIRA